jgi:hypothetical protein
MVKCGIMMVMHFTIRTGELGWMTTITRDTDQVITGFSSATCVALGHTLTTSQLHNIVTS